MRILLIALAGLSFLSNAVLNSSQTPAYKYIRAGNAANATSTPKAGFALMGGGKDLDEAFRWLCERAAGGDFLVLRAAGDDDYNPYIQKRCPLNSVATLVIPSRAASSDPFVAQAIAHATAVFIAGGDQSNYINFWMGTPVEAELNRAIRHGVPIGGTSAGLAVLGEYAYTAQGDKPDDPNLDSKTAMTNPYSPRVTLVKGFLDIPLLKNVVTDSHFAKRDRMGRLLAFVARLTAPDGKPTPGPGLKIRGIGVEEGAAVLVDATGQATVVGHGSSYFLQTRGPVEVLEPGKPLMLRNVDVQKVSPAHAFNLVTWKGHAISYTLSVENGVMHSTQPGGSIY